MKPKPVQQFTKKTCAICQTHYLAISQARNRKYCDACKVIQYNKHNEFTEYKRQQQIARNNAKASIPSPNKIQCLLCHRYYTKPMAHAWQAHGVTEREYKQAFGLERKGLIPEHHAEHLREKVAEHYEVVVAQNLLTKGKGTRYTPNHTRNYIRTPQTLARLKQLYKKNRRKIIT